MIPGSRVPGKAHVDDVRALRPMAQSKPLMTFKRALPACHQRHGPQGYGQPVQCHAVRACAAMAPTTAVPGMDQIAWTDRVERLERYAGKFRMLGVDAGIDHGDLIWPPVAS